jgi:hypothetical protein
MSDGRKVPEQSAPPEGTEGTPSTPQRTVSSPGMPRVSSPGMRVSNPSMKALSAARTAPPPPEAKLPPGQVRERLTSGASNVFLNALSIMKEMVQDFREQDRFFKYKASIIGGWALMSLLSIVIACPGQGIETAEFGARITVLPNEDKPTAKPSLTVTNMDEEPWVNVVFLVNGKYSTRTIPKIDAGGDFTLTPRLLANDVGTPMPADERFINAEMRTEAGKAELVREGRPLTQ